jgi:hypothetical protein
MYYYTTILQAITTAFRYQYIQIHVQALHSRCKTVVQYLHPKQKRPLKNSSPSHLISYKSSRPIQCPLLPIQSRLMNSRNQAKSNPNPFIQARYLVTISAHAAWGSLAVEKSMHSSRAAFSSLHTQQGLTLGAPSSPGGLFDAARLLIWEEALP